MTSKTIGKTRIESVSAGEVVQDGKIHSPVKQEKKKFSRYREWVPGEKYLVSVEELQRRLEAALKRHEPVYAQLLQDMIDLRTNNVRDRAATEIRLTYRNAEYRGV